MSTEPHVVQGDPPHAGQPIIYVVRANRTNYINYMKPLILASELRIPHTIAIISTSDPSYQHIHPERFVPAIKDRCAATGKELYVFESTACLEYLAETYDAGTWRGHNAWERAQVSSWTAYQTAGLGATAKFWLYFQVVYPSSSSSSSDNRPIPTEIVQHLKELTLHQWTRLNQRLAPPEQSFVALPDRPTIADISYLPFAMPWMFEFFGVCIDEWPHVKAWAERMMRRGAVVDVLERAPSLGN